MKTMKEYMDLVHAPLAEVMAAADRVRRVHQPDILDVCSIYNARSGCCSEDCKFCAQSVHYETGVTEYPLRSEAELMAAAERARALGAKRFGIVTSGPGMTDSDIAVICRAIPRIAEMGLIPCASLGALSYETLAQLKAAGLVRYHHNIETAPSFYAQIVSTHSFSERLTTIQNAKKAGLQVCSGGIMGLGETWEQRIEMVLTLEPLGLDAVPINFLMPIKGTPLQDQPLVAKEEALRILAIFRLILKTTTIKIAAGRETVLTTDQIRGFQSGANGMIIGGYLTMPGQQAEKDQQLIRDIEAEWQLTAFEHVH